VALPAALGEQVRRGLPEIDLRELPAARGLEPGAATRLLDSRGRAVGAGIADPDRGVFRVWSARPVEAFDGSFFRARVDAALKRRAPLLASPGTDAFRLLHGDGEGLCGLTVDSWAGFLTVQAFGRGPARWSPLLEEALAAALRPRGIVRKLVYPEEPTSRGPHKVSPLERGKVEEEVVLGERPPERLVVHEDGVPFAVKLLGSRHAGLFTDMREERRRVRALSGGLRVLNTFAYTGSFSVAAALGGAEEVVSVDVVSKVLEWAKENFRLSGIDPARHRFIRMDVLDYLALARRRDWAFGAIVLDPPTFAAGKRSRWSLRRDSPALIRRALEILSPGGHLWVAANAAQLPAAEVERWIAAAASAAGRRLKAVARAGQPLDYPAPAGFPRYRYLKIHVLRG
jgi:23S rRNA (cytosine1962-C5)-methyltransferase